MPSNRSEELLKFAQLQLAAEAFLEGLDEQSEKAEIVSALEVGNRHASRFPEELANQLPPAGTEYLMHAHFPGAPGGAGRGQVHVVDTGYDQYK